MSESYIKNVIFANKDIIKKHMSIVDVADQFFTLTDNGREDQAKTLTPERAKKKHHVSTREHGSLVLFPDTNSFYWFREGKGGDIFHFMIIMPEINMSFYQAYRYLNEHMDYSNIDVASEREKMRNKEKVEKINEKEMLSVSSNTDSKKIEAMISYTSLQLKMIDERLNLNGMLAIPVFILNQQKDRYQTAVKLNRILMNMSKRIDAQTALKKSLHLEKSYADGHITSKQARAYLGVTRKIKWELIDELRKSGCIIQDRYGEHRYVTFVNRDCYGLINGINKRQCDKVQRNPAIKVYEDTNNINKGWLLDWHDDGFNGSSGDTSKQLFVFESYIDMLSYISMRMDDGIEWHQDAYLSLGGVSKLDYVMSAMEDTQYQKVFIGFDHDEAGETNAKRLKDRLDEKGIENKRIVSIGKDWNEDIINIRNHKLAARSTDEIENGETEPAFDEEEL
jgi:hypothetical protein